jgi:GNAT superfamily N-acetyltransferase
MARLEIRPLTDELLDGAGRLLAERQRSHRERVPALDAAFEDPSVARAEVGQLLSGQRATGLAAVRDGDLIGYLIGNERDSTSWGPNVWVEGAGHAAADTEVARALYAASAGSWVEAGRTLHYVIAPAGDAALIEAWFSMGFGSQHVHAIRDAPGADFEPAVPTELAVRRAVAADLPALAALDLVVPTHQAAAPVFSHTPILSFEESLAEWEADGGVDDPRFATFVTERDGEVVGFAVGCSIDESKEHRGIVRPPGAGFLGYAAVAAQARGLGAGRVLGEIILAWARDAGHATVVTDWRSTNIESNRTWRALGFQPMFYRLHRAIA